MSDQTQPNYERVKAEDVQVGDRIARARTHTFRMVIDKRVTTVAVRLFCDRGWVIRPRRDMMLWRETREN
jgi:hypothetical protein